MKKLKTHLYYTWHVYVIVLAMLCSAIYFAHDLLIQPASTEEIRIVFLGSDFDTETLKKELLDILPEYTTQPISSIRASAMSYPEYSADTVLYSVANEADLIITEANAITPEFASFYFYSGFDADLFENEIYYADGVPCGVYLDGANTKNIYSGNDRLILFFGYKSPNLSQLNGTGSKENNAALEAAKWLMR